MKVAEIIGQEVDVAGVTYTIWNESPIRGKFYAFRHLNPDAVIWAIIQHKSVNGERRWVNAGYVPQPTQRQAVSDTPAKTIARASDPDTSKAAARTITYRTGSQKARLLRAYANIGKAGLTDEEAAQLAGIETGYWKRCSDLRNEGMIEPLTDDAGTIVTRVASSQMAQRVCVITDRGLATLGATKDDNDRTAAPIPVPHGTYAPCPGCDRSIDIGYYDRCPDCEREYQRDKHTEWPGGDE